VAGDRLPYVSYHYDHSDDYPGERVLVIGGGRSADWAATELHDAGRSVVYVMRQGAANHLRLIRDSLHLPYYARIAEILSLKSPRFDVRYLSKIGAFLPDGLVTVTGPEGTRSIAVDHAIIEIGGDPDYDLLKDFSPLALEPKRDRYRFQVCQMAVRPHSFESVDIGGLYPAGYLAQGTGLSVLGMHGTAYPIGRDILDKAGLR
jgi:thioredoxin reductase